MRTFEDQMVDRIEKASQELADCCSDLRNERDDLRARLGAAEKTIAELQAAEQRRRVAFETQGGHAGCRVNEKRMMDKIACLERECERYRHGTQVEGDYVCTHEFENMRLRERVAETGQRCKELQDRLEAEKREVAYASGCGECGGDINRDGNCSNKFCATYEIAAALAAEREACADICDQHASVEGIAEKCAAAIRARGTINKESK